MAKSLVLDLILDYLAQIPLWSICPEFWLPKFFFEFFFQALSVTRYHGQLSSCTISEKTNDPILRKLSGGRTDGQTETDESDFMRHCPTHVVHSINHPHCIQSKFNCPEIKKTLSSNSLVFFYVLNNYFYSQVAPSYVPYKPFLFFFFSKILISFSCLFLPFGFFLLQKEFDIFYMLLFWVFLCVFNIHLPFLYIEKKIVKKYSVFFLVSVFFNFLHQNFVHPNFFSWEFSSSELSSSESE